MALENLVGTDKFIDDLVDTNPASTDDVSEGYQHLQGIKNVLGNSFPGVTGAVTSTHTELNLLDGVTATTAELNLLDGVTATTAELNYVDGVTSNIQAQIDAIDNNATFTNGDVPCLSTTIFDFAGITPAITEATWESLGPTGSGKDNIWTALDSVATDADWIEVSVHMSGTSNADTGGIARNIFAYARANGSSTSAGNSNLVFNMSVETSSTGYATLTGLNTIKIPVSSRSFDFQWNNTFNGTPVGYLKLIGYGKNGTY